MKLNSLLYIAYIAAIFLPSNIFAQVISPFELEMYNIITALDEKITQAIHTSLISNSVIYDGSYRNRTTTMKMITSIYSSGLIEYTKCEHQKFGTNDEYTDFICGLNEAAFEVCKQERICDHKEWKNMPLYAMKSDVLKDTTLVARALCGVLDKFPYTITDCPQNVYSTLMESAKGVQNIIENMPDGYNNPLLTLGAIQPESYESFGGGRIHGIGDSFIDSKAEIFDYQVFSNVNEAYFKLYSLHSLATFIRDDYKKLNPTKQSEFKPSAETYFSVLIVQGYLLQKYSAYSFSPTSTQLSDDVPKVFRYLDSQCPLYLGAFMAWNCYSIERLFEVSDQIVIDTKLADVALEDVCTQLTKQGGQVMKSMIATGENTLRYNIGSRCINGCRDNDRSFSIKGIDGKKTCDWAIRLNVPGPGNMPGRCRRYEEIRTNCPDTCHSCCKDATGKFKIVNGRLKGKSCKWVRRKNRKNRCLIPLVKDLCPEVCNLCPTSAS
jgi:hypothetical protein